MTYCRTDDLPAKPSPDPNPPNGAHYAARRPTYDRTADKACLTTGDWIQAVGIDAAQWIPVNITVSGPSASSKPDRIRLGISSGRPVIVSEVVVA